MKYIFTCFVLAMVLLYAQGPAMGQVAPAKLDTFTLKDLLNVRITTASRTSQSASLASAKVIVITREQIRSRNYQSLLDVILDLPDIKVDDKMYSGMRNSLTIRGTQGTEKILVLLDGVNIGTPSGEALPVMENYPVHFAEQIEILYGPASALYGADAVSGIVNIITRKSFYKKIATEVSVTGGSYGYTNSQFLMAAKLGKKTQLLVAGQYSYDKTPNYSRIYKNDSLASIEDYRTGSFHTMFGTMSPLEPVNAAYESPMQAYNIYAALRNGDISFTFFRNYTRIPTALGNNPRNAIFNKDVFMGQAVTVANATYKKSFDKINSTTSLTASSYSMDAASSYRNIYTGMERGYKYSSTTMMRAEQQVDYSHSEKLQVTAGSTFEFYNATPQSADLAGPVNKNTAIMGTYLGTQTIYNPSGLAAPFYNIQYNNLGAYAQGQYEPCSGVAITIGARYDRNSRFGSSFNPRLGMVFNLSKTSTLKILYGRAFRAPTPSDSYTQYGSFETHDSGRTYHSHFMHLPNTGLKPVRSHHAEFNLEKQFSDNLVLSIDGYYTYLSGLYAFADDNTSTGIYNNRFNGIPVDFIQVFINSDRQKNFGGSFQLKWKKSFPGFSASSHLSLSYVNGLKEQGLAEDEETTKDMQLDFISPVMIHLGSDIKAGKFSFSPRLLIMGKQHIAGIGDTTRNIIQRQTIAGYALLNVAFRYQLSSRATLFANVINALDQRYRSVSFNMDLTKKETELYHGQPQDPIRIMTGINFNF